MTTLPTFIQSASGIDRRGILRLAAGMALLGCGVSQASAQQIASRDLSAARAKLTVYDALYNATHNLQSSWERYLSTVSGENGPTGKETRLIGVTAPNAAVAELAAAEKVLAIAPVVSEADRAAKALIQFYREAAPLLTEASAFYPTYNPTQDLGQAGQVWHRKMKSVMTFTIDARTDLYKATDAMRGDVERQELAMLEKKGRDAKWHVRAISVEARKVRDAFPKAPGPVADDLDARLSAFAALADKLGSFDQANPGQLMMFASAPKSFQTTIETLRAKMSGRPDPKDATSADLVVALTGYAQLVQFADLFFMNQTG